MQSEIKNSNMVNEHGLLIEQGKKLHLKKKYPEALELYREALRQAQFQGASLITLRHYSECIIESLELMGEYEAVIACCNEAIDYYQSNPPQSDLALRDFAALYERKAMVSAKSTDWSAAGEATKEGLQIANSAGFEMPLLSKLSGWIKSRYYLAVDRIEKEQRAAGYFAVREESV